MTTKKPELPVIPFASHDAWEAWLEGHHATSEGLWLKFAKKGSGIETVTYDQAVEAALCYGWIDGQVTRFDEDYYLQRFTPRRSRSKWYFTSAYPQTSNRRTATASPPRYANSPGTPKGWGTRWWSRPSWTTATAGRLIIVPGSPA